MFDKKVAVDAGGLRLARRALVVHLATRVGPGNSSRYGIERYTS
jgi:hypothetical protein